MWRYLLQATWRINLGGLWRDEKLGADEGSVCKRGNSCRKYAMILCCSVPAPTFTSPLMTNESILNRMTHSARQRDESVHSTQYLTTSSMPYVHPTRFMHIYFYSRLMDSVGNRWYCIFDPKMSKICLDYRIPGEKTPKCAQSFHCSPLLNPYVSYHKHHLQVVSEQHCAPWTPVSP